MVQSLLAPLFMAFRKSSGTRSANGARPQIAAVTPAAAIPGGDFQIRGSSLANGGRPHVRFGNADAQIIVGSDAFVIARVPQGTANGDLLLGNDLESGAAWPCRIGAHI